MKYNVTGASRLVLSFTVLLAFTVGLCLGAFHGGDAVCGHIRHRWSSAIPKRTDFPEGLWLSERCETRPGPEYLLRRYSFKEDRAFEALQFYYEDPGCTQPSHAILATGKLTSAEQSWLIPGAQHAEYDLRRVTIVPYSEQRARKLSLKINQACLNAVPWQPYEKYDVMHLVSEFRDGEEHAVVDKDCTRALDWTMHELQLFMIQERKHPHTTRQELFLGDIHTDPEQRRSYRPTSFQHPLLKEHSAWCGICKRLAEADLFHPTHTNYQQHPKTESLTGDWLSVRCETRPGAVFLSRHIRINIDGTWRGVFTHYSDPRCVTPSFSVYAQGTYTHVGQSNVIEGAMNYNFVSDFIKVRPEDARMVRFLNSEDNDDCGHGTEWKRGVEIKVDPRAGCRALSLHFPFTEHNIASIEKTHQKVLLNLGQRATDGRPLSSDVDRPTSYQSPLVRCDRYNVRLLTSNKSVPKSERVALDAVAEKSIGPVQLDSSSTRMTLSYTIMTLISIYLMF